MSLIKARNIIISNPSLIIDEFEVNAGDIVRLKGDSGVGKSTFLKALVKLKKITKGSILFDSEEYQDAKDIRSQLLYIPQFSGSETLTVNSFIEGIFNINNCPNDISEDLKELGVDRIIDKRIDQISGGERQILNILIALKLDRKVLLCDESFSAIDPVRCKLLIKKMLTWCSNMRSIVYISHQELDLDRVATHVYELKKTQEVVSLSKL